MYKTSFAEYSIATPIEPNDLQIRRDEETVYFKYDLVNFLRGTYGKLRNAQNRELLSPELDFLDGLLLSRLASSDVKVLRRVLSHDQVSEFASMRIIYVESDDEIARFVFDKQQGYERVTIENRGRILILENEETEGKVRSGGVLLEKTNNPYKPFIKNLLVGFAFPRNIPM